MIIILYLLALCGVVSIGHLLYRLLFHKKINHAVIAEVNTDNAEGVIRCLMRENPNAEIFVIDQSNCKECGEIIEKLCMDYARVHKAECVNDAVTQI